jgi:alkylhydroperoxidase family enzyme
MLTSLIDRQLTAHERMLGAGTLDYMRTIWRDAPGAFWAFARARRFLDYRKTLDVTACHVARIVATQHEDCGTCVQMAVNAARADGVDVAVLRALVAGDAGALTPALAQVAAFARAVCAADYAAVAELQPAVARQVGAAAMVELSMAIAAARTFPTIKRAMGIAVSCSRVQVVA